MMKMKLLRFLLANMDSKILKELYESAEGMYQAGTMPRDVYLKFKDLYESQKTGNKVCKKMK